MQGLRLLLVTSLLSNMIAVGALLQPPPLLTGQPPCLQALRAGALLLVEPVCGQPHQEARLHRQGAGCHEDPEE